MVRCGVVVVALSKSKKPTRQSTPTIDVVVPDSTSSLFSLLALTDRTVPMGGASMVNSATAQQQNDVVVQIAGK